VLDGGAGDDDLAGGAAPDTISSGDGDDLIHAGGGADTVDAGAGDDVIAADSGEDHIAAGAGDDTVYINDGTAVGSVDCGPGFDVIVVNHYMYSGGASNESSRLRGEIRDCEWTVGVVPAYDPSVGLTNGRGTIDCGPGNDTVFTGHKRPRLHGCEHVVNQYKITRRGTHR
jgi:Ca2+-binding RTX toxin-like protein